ncbi:MAG: lycopene cyclase domain-containing protein [Deltaproteobacteria bacterium]
MSEADVPASWPYAYLMMSAALLLVWLVLYGVRTDLRRSTLGVSLATALLGLTEPLFVPKYWNPFTLFKLARSTGFDLESLVFSFAIGGIVFSAYEVLFRTAPSQSMADERHQARHRHHLLALAAAPLVFVILALATRLNPIYSSAIALVAGFFATLYCRPDLWLKMIVSGGLFLAVYFIVFLLFNLAFPGYVVAVWNLKVLSGVRLLGVPLEELMFALTFGLYWSSTYEHLMWRRGHALSGSHL